jgi:folate-binding protein YgfZ
MLDHPRFSGGHFTVKFSVFKIEGSDAESFLSAQSTYDVKLLNPDCFHLASFLDPQGRLQSYGWLLRRENDFLYLVPPKLREKTLERLNRFLVAEDVEIGEVQEEYWSFTFGHSQKGFKGILFDEEVTLSVQKNLDENEIPEQLIQSWRVLTGYPSFNAENFKEEILNQTLLHDLSLSQKKGCYPGQETVSKIATHRGAAFSPVLIEVHSVIPQGPIKLEGRKIGEIEESASWNGKTFLSAKVLRDFRIESGEIHGEVEGSTFRGIVHYFPFLKGSSSAKSLELFYAGAEAFRLDDLSSAEKFFRASIEMNPKNSDSYEALGVMLGRLDRYQEAIELMDKLAESDPDSVMAHTNKSLYLMKLGKIEEAEAEKSKATLKSFAKFGKEASDKRVKEEQEKKQQKEWEERESLFLQVLEIDPEDTLANYGVGSIAVEKKDWAKARDHLEKVLTVDEKYSVAYLALGKAYLGLGENQKAKEIFQKGIKVAAAKGDLMPANQMQAELSRI